MEEVPGRQLEQLDAPVLAWNVPAAQLAQLDDVDAPVDGPKAPTAQFWQLEAAALVWNLPAAQGEQLAEAEAPVVAR